MTSKDKNRIWFIMGVPSLLYGAWMIHAGLMLMIVGIMALIISYSYFIKEGGEK